MRAVMNLGFDADFRRGVREGRWSGYDELRPRVFDGPPGPSDFMANGGPDWSRIDAVEMKWNRLVCFPGFAFHPSHYDPSWFGAEPETDRVIQNLDA